MKFDRPPRDTRRSPTTHGSRRLESHACHQVFCDRASETLCFLTVYDPSMSMQFVFLILALARASRWLKRWRRVVCARASRWLKRWRRVACCLGAETTSNYTKNLALASRAHLLQSWLANRATKKSELKGQGSLLPRPSLATEGRILASATSILCKATL